MHIIQETSKTPRADVYRLANVIACCSFCDLGHDDWVKQPSKLLSTTSFRFPSYLNIRYNKIQNS